MSLFRWTRAGARQHLWRPVLAGLGMLSLLALYWIQLLGEHDRMRDDVRANTFRLSEQTAQALALQVDTLTRKLDYFSLQLAAAWQAGDTAAFERDVITAMEALPPGALMQVTVADADGDLQYSRSPEARVSDDVVRQLSIANREYFKAQLEAEESLLYIGYPLRGMLSGQWAVPFSRSLWRDGVFQGVLVMSISAAHLSQALTQIFPEGGDVAFVVRADGTYLARSQGLENALGKSAPSHWPFLQGANAEPHHYEATADVDGVTRLYGWSRTPGYPLVLGVGFERGKAMASPESAVASSLWRSAATSLVLVAILLIVLYLWIQRSRQSADLRQVRERLELAVVGGGLATWDWRLKSDELRVNEAWGRLFDEDNPDGLASFAAWCARVPPQDATIVRAALERHMRGELPEFDVEYRILAADGQVRWVASRGRIVEWDETGAPQRMAGTLLDISARKAAEAAEEASQRRLTKLVEEVPGAVYQYQLEPDGSSFFPYASAGVRQVYDLTPEDLQHSADEAFQRIYLPDLSRVSESIVHSSETLQPWSCEYRVVHRDGSVHWVQGRAKPERLASGATLWHGYLHDVTQEHTIAEALKASESHLRLALAAVRDGLWSFDHETRLLESDARILEMLGYPEAYRLLPIDDFLALVHSAERPRVLDALRQPSPSEGELVVRLDYRLRTSSGDWLWVQSRGRVVEWSDDGLPRRSMGMLSDIQAQVVAAQWRDVLLNRNAVATTLVGGGRRLIEANQEFKSLFLPPGTELSQLKVSDIHLDMASWEAFNASYEALRRDGSVRVEYPFRDVRGRTHWFDMHGMLRDPDDPESDVIWTMVDISDRHLADAALSVERLRLTTLLERFPGGVLIEDADKVVVFVNDTWCRLLELRQKAVDLVGLEGAVLRSLIGPLHAGWFDSREAAFGEVEGGRREVSTQQGRHLDVDHVELRRRDEHLGVVWFVHDVTVRRQKELEMARLASTDSLTGLPNRRSFLARLEQLMRTVDGGPPEGGALLMLDIDHFKRVNDSYGHAVGDAVLSQVATLILQELRGTDMAGRLGGEEFSVLLPGASLEDGRRVAERIRMRTEASVFKIEGKRELRITVSLGAAKLEDVGPEAMLQRVDEAMYAAKQSGRNRVRLWPLLAETA